MFKKMRKKTILFSALSLMFVMLSFTIKAQVKLLSGVESEIYNQFANDIKNNTNVAVDVITTGGSVDNFMKINADSAKENLAFMQYDVLIWKEIENPKIKDKFKVFLPLYNEEIHIIVKNNSKITSLADLKGKKVAIGSKSQGANITSQIIKNKTCQFYSNSLLKELFIAINNIISLEDIIKKHFRKQFMLQAEIVAAPS